MRTRLENINEELTYKAERLLDYCMKNEFVNCCLQEHLSYGMFIDFLKQNRRQHIIFKVKVGFRKRILPLYSIAYYANKAKKYSQPIFLL